MAKKGNSDCGAFYPCLDLWIAMVAHDYNHPLGSIGKQPKCDLISSFIEEAVSWKSRLYIIHAWLCSFYQWWEIIRLHCSAESMSTNCHWNPTTTKSTVWLTSSTSLKCQGQRYGVPLQYQRLRKWWWWSKQHWQFSTVNAVQTIPWHNSKIPSA